MNETERDGSSNTSAQFCVGNMYQYKQRCVHKISRPTPIANKKTVVFSHSSLCFPNNYLSTFKKSSFVILYISIFIFSPVKESLSIVSAAGQCLNPIRSNIFLLYLLRSKHPAVIASNEKFSKMYSRARSIPFLP